MIFIIAHFMLKTTFMLSKITKFTQKKDTKKP